MKLFVSSTARRILALLIGLLTLASVAGWLWIEQLAPTTADNTGALVVDEPEPIGREAYDLALGEAAGQDLDGQTLEEAARRALEAYEDRLDALAARIASQAGVDWRDVFSQLEQDHPPDASAVLEAYRAEIERQQLFLEPLALLPEPPGPATVVANENPIFRRYFSLAMYLEGQLAVTLEAGDGRPDEASPGDATSSDYLINHCWACIPPLVAHEVAPGHHVAYSVAATAVPDAAERLASNRQNVVYHEGWGLYSEQLMLELGYYDDPALELGAVRLLYLRALRAVIDPALHRGEIDRDDAIEIYRQKAQLGADAAAIEVARHLKDPTLKASYFIGLQQILALRHQVLGDAPTATELGDFHHRFLGRPRPIPHIAQEVFGVDLSSAASLGNFPS